MSTTILPAQETGSVAPDVRSPEPVPERPGRPAPRSDIQALRAVAVGLVLVYHLWPTAITGGFVGVDVFFVVSGFLITAHLLGRPPRTVRDFAGFWARRIRRLLPASLLVLAVTLIASRIVAPETQWVNTAKQAIAAALYVENWVLAADSVDYLASGNAPTPVQHFWSLSVEEQFYLFWPLLIALLTVLVVRRRWPRAVLVGLLAVVVVSLGVSVLFTAQSPAQAYFVTPTRAWEFGLGGLLAAALVHRASRPRVHGQFRLTDLGRTVLAGAGLLAIGYAAFTFDATTPFPGWSALIPTLGAVAVLAAMPTPEVGRLGRVLAVRPVQWLGDASYSVYLWHWPLIVLVPYLVGGPLGLHDRLAIVVVTLFLAGLTKRFVEDPFRSPSRGRGLRRVFVAAAAGMALVLLLALVQVAEVARSTADEQRRLDAALAAGEPCLGAGTLHDRDRCRDVTFEGVLPAPKQAPRDRSELYPDVSGRPTCWADAPSFAVRTCQFGDPSAKRHLALVGNSHAGQWLPALQEIAARKGWRITTYVASRCALAPVEQRLMTPALMKSCAGWVDKVSATVEKGDFDLVVLSNRMSRTASGTATPEESVSAYQKAYEKMLSRWAEAKVRTLALRDTPAPADAGITSVPDCVAQHPDDLSRCSGTRQDWIPEEPLVAAVREIDTKRIKVADMSKFICETEICRPVVGGIMVYYDGQHLSATFARTLAAPLAKKMRRLIKRA